MTDNADKEERAAEYRALAEELRAVAAALKSKDIKSDLIGLANSYDRMADCTKNPLPGEPDSEC